ncbi:MAG: multidrug RND transporter, partial [Kangiellaceae bacterium]|nr:multidrug RND transporter [Kangiellaceae bacterium]
MQQSAIHRFVEKAFFQNRAIVLTLFTVITLGMLYLAVGLKVDASFEKNIPLEHPYMQTYLKHQESFGGANRVLVALEDQSGDIFNQRFFEVLARVTDEVNAVTGVNQPQTQSLFTPNTRYIEVVEDGLQGGPVIHESFDGLQDSLEKVRANTLKGGYVGRLVSNDFSAAMISTQLFSIDSKTKAKIDFIQVAGELEQIRESIEAEYPDVKV